MTKTDPQLVGIASQNSLNQQFGQLAQLGPDHVWHFEFW